MENLHQIIFSENVCRQFSEEVLQQGNINNLKHVCNFLNSIDKKIGYSSFQIPFSVRDFIKQNFDDCNEYNDFFNRINGYLNHKNIYNDCAIFCLKRRLNIFPALQQISWVGFSHKGKIFVSKLKNNKFEILIEDEHGIIIESFIEE